MKASKNVQVMQPQEHLLCCASQQQLHQSQQRTPRCQEHNLCMTLEAYTDYLHNHCDDYAHNDFNVKQSSTMLNDTLNENVIHLRKTLQDHGDHHHETWQAQATVEKLQDAVQWKINEDQEGCPCCVAGLDFDEFAVAIKELNNVNSSTSEQIAQLADFQDGGHWGVFLGVAAPLGLIGLTAALRNVKGSWNNLKTLKHIIHGLNQDIARYRSMDQGQEQQEIIQKLTAFRNTLKYSKFDSEFNIVFPGVVNGVASSLVLSTLVVSHPFALPAIAMYATGQLARNTYDYKRNINRSLQLSPHDSLEILQAKRKVNQIHQSKQRFYKANSVGFAAFTVGATLTFLSIPALSIGIGAVGLPLGLALLSAGALSTGIMNNIWPRKFRPRNASLGVERLKIKGQHDCLQEIQRRVEHKKIIATFGAGILNCSLWQKRFLKVLTALPQFKDFVPSSAAKILDKVFPPLKYCGTAATAKKHRLNFQIVADAYADIQQIEALDYRRVIALGQMAKESVQTTQPLQQSWELLDKLDLQPQVLDIFLNESFQGKEGKVKKSEPDQTNQEKNSQCCHQDHSSGHNNKGLHALKGVRILSETEAYFDVEDFLNNASSQEHNKLRASIDYYLYFVHRKQMQYQQYGLIDYMWSLTAAKSSETQKQHDRVVQEMNSKTPLIA